MRPGQAEPRAKTKSGVLCWYFLGAFRRAEHRGRRSWTGTGAEGIPCVRRRDRGEPENRRGSGESPPRRAGAPRTVRTGLSSAAGKAGAKKGPSADPLRRRGVKGTRRCCGRRRRRRWLWELWPKMLCENFEISLSAKNFSHFAFNSSPATVYSWDDMLVLGK